MEGRRIFNISKSVLIMFIFSLQLLFAQTHIFTNQIPSNSGNDSDYELGVKFTSSQSALVTSIRFYKMPGETGEHTGNLWTSSGSLLASAVFAGETSSGWQEAELSSPVIISPGTVYIASVNSNTVYPIEQNQLGSSVSNGFLSTVADGNNGVFNETPGNFPAQSYNNSNYYVDISASEINTIFTTETPAGEFNDGPYELGVKFTVSQIAKVRFIRYYKTAGESGAHTGNIWDASGNLLASAVFSGESASGWQYAGLNSSLILSPGNTYVVSVNSNFTYAASEQHALDNSVTSGILSTVADNNNGVYSGLPNTQGQFPTASFNNVNYFRDIVVEPVATPAEPDLITPVNLSEGNSIEPLFTWTSVAGAESYTLQVATDQAFSNIKINESDLSSASFSASGLLNNKTYYWRVRASNEIVDGNFSAVSKFTTAPKTSVELSWPVAGVYLYTFTPTFSWYIPTGGTGWKFDLIYSTDADFNTNSTVSNITSFTYTLSNLTPGVKYYWKIRLKNSEGEVVSYSDRESFISFGKTSVPYISWPTANAVVNTLSPSLFWYITEAGSGLTYELEYVQGSASALTGTPNVINITAKQYNLTGLLPDKQYTWKVRSKSGDNYSAWSTAASFKTAAIGEPIKPIPSWPVAGATVYSVSPTLNWYLGADGSGLTYEVEIVEGSGTAFSGAPNFTNIQNLNVQMSNLNPGKTYKYRVRSTNGMTYSSWSSTATFKIESALSIGPIVPIPSWPIGSAYVYSDSTQLYWYLGALNPGLTFEVEYGTGSLTGTPSITGISDMKANVNDLQAGVTYNWRVRSTDGVNYSAWSPVQKFKTVNLNPVASVPYLSWPVGGYTVYTTSPVLSWFLATGSSGITFDLQYSASSNMSGAVTVTGLTAMQYALSNLQAGKTYYWRIRSFDGTVYSNYSAKGKFVVNAGSASVVPEPASPGGGITIESTAPELSWFIPTEGDVASYELQYSSDSEMKDAVTVETGSTSQLLSGLQTGKTYYWRVRSKNSAGEFSAFSDIEEFSAASVTSTEDEIKVPETFELSQNYPNPFNPSTLIQYSIPKEGLYNLVVYNIIGQKVAELVNAQLMPGRYSVRFDGSGLSSGAYIYRLSGSGVNIVRKMLLLK